MRSDPMTPETLLQNTGWMARLARRIVEDQAAADDIVQEAWLASLRGELPEAADSRRGWLATVSRRLAWGHLRGRRRSRARERAAARPEAESSTLDLVERAEAHRLVVEAVLALDDPYRGLLLERYFEGLSAAEIARRRGAKAATIRSQLQRGLEKLRARFEARDQRRLALSLIPLALRAPSAGAGAGLAASLIAAAALILSVGFSALALREAPEATPGRELARAGEAGPVVGPPALAPVDLRSPALAEAAEKPKGTGLAPSRTPAAPARSMGGFAALPRVGEGWSRGALNGRVQDLRGQPVAGVTVVLAGWQAPGGRSVSISSGPRPVLGQSDDQGRFRFEGALPERGDLDVLASGRVTVFRASFKRDQDREALILISEAQPPLAGLVVDEAGRPLAGAEVSYSSTTTLESYPEELDRSGLIRVEFEIRSGPDGRFEFTALPELPAGEVWASLSGYQPAGCSVVELVRRPALTLKRAPKAVISGRVLHKDGRPASGAEVWYSGRLGQADADGRFAFPVQPNQSPDRAAVVAVLQGWQPAAVTVTRRQLRGLPPLELTLAGRARAISGRLVDAAGAPLVGWRLSLGGELDAAETIPRTTAESLADPRRFEASVKSDRAGRFCFGGLRDRGYEVLARDLKTGRAARASARAGEEELVVRVEAGGVYPRLSGRVVSSAGRPVAGVQVCGSFVLASAGGATSSSQTTPVTTDDAGRFELADFPREDVKVQITGEAILPAVLALPEDADAEELVLRVALRRRLKVEFGHLEPRPQGFAILDAAGRALSMRIYHSPGSFLQAESFRLRPGQEATEVLTVPDTATTLRLTFADGRVRSLFLRLDSDEVTVVRP